MHIRLYVAAELAIMLCTTLYNDAQNSFIETIELARRAS